MNNSTIISNKYDVKGPFFNEMRPMIHAQIHQLSSGQLLSIIVIPVILYVCFPLRFIFEIQISVSFINFLCAKKKSTTEGGDGAVVTPISNLLSTIQILFYNVHNVY